MGNSVCVLTNVHHLLDPRIFYKEALSLARAGYAVTVMGPGPADLEGCREGVELRPLPLPGARWGRLVNLGRLLRAGWRERAQFYHLHDPELLPVGLALRLAGRRVVYDVHEHFPQVILVRAWVPGWLRGFLSRLVDAGERWCARRLSGVVGVVEEQGGRFCGAPFLAIKNYPRLEWFSPAVERPGPELIHVGSLSAERGALFLLEIMRALRQTHPQARLLVVGRFHTPEIEASFKQQLEEYGLQGRVEFRTAPVPYPRLGALIRASRIGLIPGQVSAQNLAPFVPTKLFEYLACGLPVVASDLPSIRGFYAAADWGILAEPADPDAHARAIGLLLDRPQEAQAKGMRGRAVVEARFNWEAEERKLLSFYAGAERRAR